MRDEVDDLVEGARSRRAQKRFQLRECEFNGTEVGTVGREEAQVRAGLFNRELHRRMRVRGQVVQHDDVAGPQRRGEHLLDVGEERRAISRTVEHRGSAQFHRTAAITVCVCQCPHGV